MGLERALYALERRGDQARLLRLELQSRTAQVLGEWRLGSGVERAFLSATWDGDMLLATTGGGSFRVSQFKLEGGALVSGWYVEGEGALVAKPALKRAGLDVITINPNGVRSSWRLPTPSQGAPVSLGSCLE